MSTREELEQLSSKELHDRAIDLAQHRLDIGFFWRLLRTIPAAEAAIGHVDDADANVINPLDMLNDWTEAGEGELADALRPMYLDYLLAHAKTAD
jgi:hypothetical protein